VRLGRVLLKLSGEAFRQDEGHPFGHERLMTLAQAIHRAVQAGSQIGIVIGAGNIFRARSANLEVIGRVTADHVGMLGTVMNAGVLRAYLEAEGVRATIFGPRTLPPLVRSFSREEALPLLQDGQVLIFAGGTGNPYFTTDSAAALRALEIGADALLKGTQVDGVYAEDPRTHPGAERFAELSYQEVLARRLGVMDLTAIALCADSDLPIIVFDVSRVENLHRLLAGERGVGTWITKEPSP
jgi:uridylate kinase